MSEELKQINDSIKEIGTAWEASKKTQDELDAKIAKNEGGQAEIKAKIEKIDEHLNEALDMKKSLEETAAAVKRMGGSLEEKLEKKGVDVEVYGNALKKWVKSGFKMESLNEVEQKAMSSQSNPDGGYSIQPFMGGTENIIFDTSPMRALASVASIGTNEYIGKYDDERSGSRWAGEGDSVATTSTPQIGEFSIKIKKLEAYPETTEELMEDSNFNIASWLQQHVSEDFGLKEATAFVTGAGVVDPRGIMTYTQKTSNADVYTRGQVGTLETAAAGAITTDELVSLRALLKGAYRGNAYFGYNRATEAVIRKLKDGQGNYIWQPNYQAGEADQLLGQRTVILEDMADVGSDALSVVLADFRKSYLIVDRVGISVLEDKFTSLPNTRFYIRKRVGGGVKCFDSIKYLKQAT